MKTGVPTISLSSEYLSAVSNPNGQSTRTICTVFLFILITREHVPDENNGRHMWRFEKAKVPLDLIYDKNFPQTLFLM